MTEIKKRKCVSKIKQKIYDISEIDFINVVCLDGNEKRLFVSLSSGVVVALLTNDDDVGCRDSIGGRISRFFDGGFAVDGKSSLFVNTKSSTIGCFGGE